MRAVDAFPPALAGLARLRSFGWSGPAPGARKPLPDGPWLASLRVLAVPADVAAASAAQLAAATQLRDLGLSRFAPGGGTPDQFSPLRAAARHPCLARVCLHLRDHTLSTALFDAALEAQRCRPGLAIERSNAVDVQLRSRGLQQGL